MPVSQKMKMDINRCFEILELDRGASRDEVKQAYKDLVNIWHPDRFSSNLPLRQKAEKKLKEINQAYERVEIFLSQKPEQGKGRQEPSRAQARARTENWAGSDKTEVKTRTEAAVEAGTFAALSLWSYLSKRLRRIVAEQVQAFKEGAEPEPQGTNRTQARGRGKGGGAGRGRGGGQGVRRRKGARSRGREG
jgi:hypothetical protein